MVSHCFEIKLLYKQAIHLIARSSDKSDNEEVTDNIYLVILDRNKFIFEDEDFKIGYCVKPTFEYFILVIFKMELDTVLQL